MTDKQIEEKRKEFYEGVLLKYHSPLLVAGRLDRWVVDGEGVDKVWQWIEELIKHYYTQGKIEGYKECLEENEWEMEEDKGFLFKDNKLIPIKKGFKLKAGKDQRVTKFKLGKEN